MSQNDNNIFTILLVDDREENLISLENILEEDNRIFLKATSGNEALKLALKHDNIGLIMLDVQMPDIDGFEVARLLKSNARTKDISIIFVTAINKEEQYVLKGYNHGAVDYLQKPLDISVTQSKVRVFEHLYFYQSQLKKTIEIKDTINKQLERFMFVVAHDLKSPLSGVITMLYLMKEDESIIASEELKENMDLMIKASNHLSGMISSILEYSRKNHIEQSIEEVNVDLLVKELITLLYPPGNISIIIDRTLPTLVTRKLKLQQVFQNLLSNAIKYMDKPQGLIAVGYEDDGDYFKFYVRDNGPGIAKEDGRKIFDLFATTDNPSATGESSTGIGLNIMKVNVEEQGGKVTFESEPHIGSTFYFQWLKKGN